MIARIWRGVTREADKDTYFEYLQKTGLKEYASIPGNQGVWVLRRVDDGQRHAVRPRGPTRSGDGEQCAGDGPCPHVSPETLR